MGEAAVIWGRLLGSFWLNVQLFALTLVFALPLGLIVAFGSMSRFAPLRGAVKTFVWIIRGTPLMLQVIVLFMGPGPAGSAQPLARRVGRAADGGRGGFRDQLRVLFFGNLPRRYRGGAPAARPKPGRCWA